MAKRILIASDAWAPQVSGVVRTLQSTIAELEKMDCIVEVLHPYLFRTIPTHYPGIRLAIPHYRRIEKLIDAFSPDYIHLATEGPIGFLAKRYCRKRKRSFTTAFHTNFQDYAKTYFHIPQWISWKVLRKFHHGASTVMAPTAQVMHELQEHGFNNVKLWQRGVDTSVFHPRTKTFNTPRPNLMYVGRVAPEKNIQAFLDLKIDGTKYVIGDGPELNALRVANPHCFFTGMLHGDRLAEAYSNADVFVFPSKTDTFGLVILEAVACGVPVAAYPVKGPIDIFPPDSKVGFLDHDLEKAVNRALTEFDPEAAKEMTNRYSWENATRMFLEHIVNQ